ncbi:MAG: ATP-binding cassette domain-containing protein, partial [Roseibium sp.]|nr:ATP-binding cassette domain-containing protein [Roseibium sp.]
FYLIGGYLVIEGNLSIGALLAVIAAYKDLAGPWKLLLSFYQMTADVSVKYQTVVENFDPKDIYDTDRLTSDDTVELEGDVKFDRVSFSGGAAGQEVMDISLTVPSGTACAIVGPDGSGRSEVLQLAAGLVSASSGKVSIGTHDLDKLTDATLGRQIAYVGGAVHVWTGTIRDNLYYGLRHRPLVPPERDSEAQKLYKRRVNEANQTMNPVYDLAADWDDLEAAGVDNETQLDEKALELLEAVKLDKDIYRLGLQSRFDPSMNDAFAEKILSVRKNLAERIANEPALGGLVELWDRDLFNASASLADNLFFAVPSDPEITMDQVPDLEEVRSFLSETGFDKKLQEIGLKIAETMLELFSNVSGDSGLLGSYSFINQDELPEFERIVRVARSGQQRPGLSDADRSRLTGLAFKLVPARHRLGVMTDELRDEVIAARKRFLDGVVKNSDNFVAFDPDVYLPPLTIEDNLIFGRARVDRRDARRRIDDVIRAIVEETGLRRPIIYAGFGYHVGVSGSRLSAGQRRRIALVRGLLKNAKITILDDIATGMTEDDKALRNGLRDILSGKTFLFGTFNADIAAEFDQQFVLDQGRISEKG